MRDQTGSQAEIVLVAIEEAKKDSHCSHHDEIDLGNAREETGDSALVEDKATVLRQNRLTGHDVPARPLKVINADQ